MVRFDAIHESYISVFLTGDTVVWPIFIWFSKEHDEFICGESTEGFVWEDTGKAGLESVDLSLDAPANSEIHDEVDIFLHIVDGNVNVLSSGLQVSCNLGRAYLDFNLAISG